jgi:hypothetical protein
MQITTISSRTCLLLYVSLTRMADTVQDTPLTRINILGNSTSLTQAQNSPACDHFYQHLAAGYLVQLNIFHACLLAHRSMHERLRVDHDGDSVHV